MADKAGVVGGGGDDDVDARKVVDNAVDAHKYRLAQANKIIRLGLVAIDADGDVIETLVLADMDLTQITPDPIDFEAVEIGEGFTFPPLRRP